jgi:hypothetical protein
MDALATQARSHRAKKVRLLIVASSTTEPRILRNGFTPRISSSVPHTRIATTEIRRSGVCGVPFAIVNRRVIDRTMKTDNATFGHWATVMRPVRRLTNVQRTIRRHFEEPLFCAIASSGVVTVTRPKATHSPERCRVTSVRCNCFDDCQFRTNRIRFDPSIDSRNQRVARFRVPAAEDSWPPWPAGRTRPRSLGRRRDG